TGPRPSRPRYDLRSMGQDQVRAGLELARRLIGAAAFHTRRALARQLGAGTSNPYRAPISANLLISGLSGEISRSKSVNIRDALSRDVTDTISPPPLPNRNQCVVPAGRCTSVPAEATISLSPMPNAISPLMT